MKITDALRGEHGVIYRMLSHLTENAPHYDAATLKAMGGLLESVLGSHAGIENDLLFSALDEFLPPHGGPVFVMRAEHEEIENTAASFETEDNLERLQENLAFLDALCRRHFAKEEQILFMLSEQRLDSARLEDLGQEWARRRQVSLP